MRYLISALIAAVPSGLILFAAIWSSIPKFTAFIESIGSDDARGVVPGEIPFTVEEPGEYLVWLYTQTLYEGKSYATSGLPGGVELSVKGAEGEVSVHWPSSTMTRTASSSASTAVGEFTLTAAGDYTLVVTGERGSPFVLGIGPDDFFETIVGFFKAVGLLLAGIFCGIACFALIFCLCIFKVFKKPQPASKSA